jgi:heat shock protein HslJ
MSSLKSKCLKTITVLSVATALTACVNPVKEQHNSLVGNWQIVNVQGQAISNDKARLIFSEEGSVAGNNGCNNVMGTYQPVHDHLNLSPLATTRMACKGAAQQDAQTFTKALTHVEHFLVKGDALYLTDEQDETVITLKK